MFDIKKGLWRFFFNSRPISIPGVFFYLAANEEFSLQGVFFYLAANEEFFFLYGGLLFLVFFFFIRGSDITFAGRFLITRRRYNTRQPVSDDAAAI